MSGGRSGTLLRWNRPAWLKSHTFLQRLAMHAVVLAPSPGMIPLRKFQAYPIWMCVETHLGPSKSLDSFKAAPNFRHQAPVSLARVFAGEERCLLQEEDGDAARQERGHARAGKKEADGLWAMDLPTPGRTS